MGVGTIAISVAMPFVVMGAVGAIGFGAGGIASGSMAAGMMSAEAITAGGAVAAGGTVATFQSIGAAGLGIAGASAAASDAAGSSLGIAAASGGLVNNQGRIRLEEAGSHLPLCAWRLWRVLLED